ncbi:MAG: hypothetical protein IJJ26_01475 [Victivallales bacterium]|nr:hypothetical protein [Victivallales bacterium]
MQKQKLYIDFDLQKQNNALCYVQNWARIEKQAVGGILNEVIAKLPPNRQNVASEGEERRLGVVPTEFERGSHCAAP